MYDPAIARFTTVDKSAQSYYAYSPYVYVGNNPIRRVDPDGNDWGDVVKGTVAAVVDNATGGVVNWRGSFTYNDAGDYNAGQDAGDVASVVIGGIETIGGAGVAGTGAVATVGSGGTLSIAGAPAMAGGTAMMAHGVKMGMSGASNLANQKGRVNAEGLQGAKDAQRQQRKGQAPDGVDRVDIPKTDSKGKPLHGQKPHAHVTTGKKKSAINQDGSIKHGDGSITETVKDWLQGHGWKL